MWRPKRIYFKDSAKDIRVKSFQLRRETLAQLEELSKNFNGNRQGYLNQTIERALIQLKRRMTDNYRAIKKRRREEGIKTLEKVYYKASAEDPNRIRFATTLTEEAIQTLEELSEVRFGSTRGISRVLEDVINERYRIWKEEGR